jgi:hypothetical protein
MNVWGRGSVEGAKEKTPRDEEAGRGAHTPTKTARWSPPNTARKGGGKRGMKIWWRVNLFKEYFMRVCNYRHEISYNVG